jgi:hypothetical protein
MDNMLQVVLLTVLITTAVIGIASVVYQSYKRKKSGLIDDILADIIDYIRPILADLFMNIFELYKADKEGFDGLLNFSVNYVKEKINDAPFLTDEEKALFTDEVIIALIKPKLTTLYDQKIKK